MSNAHLPMPTEITDDLAPKVRSMRQNIENKSDTMRAIVDQLTKKYCKDLDNSIDEIRAYLNDRENIEIEKLNYYVSYLPILMYYASNALENLGIEGDTAKAVRVDAFNEVYLQVGGRTIQDKTSAAQQLTLSEQLVENAFLRAYKKCKSRIEMATMLHGALKKVLQWKISELEVNGYHSSNGTDYRRN
jgi:hypothetical protein